MRRAVIAGAGLALVVGAGAVGASSGVLTRLVPSSTAGANPTAASAQPAIKTAKVAQRTLATSADLDGTLGYEASRPVLAGSPGTVTRLPDEGRVVRRGEVLYELDGTDLVFLPGAIRVQSHEAQVGSAVGPGAPILAATTATRVVTLALSASRQDLVHPGQAVTVELPDDSTLDGVVRDIGRVATADDGGSTTVPVTIDLDAAATLPDLDAAPVVVHVVTERHDDVLAVPVNALVALLEGGYAVEQVDSAGGRTYVRVETGLFQDGDVEVSGAGLAAGDSVVVSR